MEALSWLQISVKWEAKAGKKGKSFEWENEESVGTPEGPFEVGGHKFKVRSASTILGVSVEIFKNEFPLYLFWFTAIQHNIFRQGGQDFIYMRIGW